MIIDLMRDLLSELAEVESSRELKRNGFHEMNNEIHSGYFDDPLICPFGIEGYCEGFKDPEYKVRCEVKDPKDLLKCGTYLDFIAENDLYRDAKPISAYDEDTVEMTAEEVVKASQEYESLQDALEDGEKRPDYYRDFTKDLVTPPVDDRVDTSNISLTTGEYLAKQYEQRKLLAKKRPNQKVIIALKRLSQP